MALNSGYRAFIIAEKQFVFVWRMEQRKNKNAEDTVQKFMESTKQIKLKQEALVTLQKGASKS
ncbi:hypothetical protein T4A_6563 [Trichinella pseudospiralis]|uniref:Uncharacterized protein n=1 Tax=Trichinella pseudospiralis TaxID=6337 RepID=A0A0V1E6E6_TRIPS|nr:hypothetical protein T4A_6563 [Trichinella pseudospiralis]